MIPPVARAGVSGLGKNGATTTLPELVSATITVTSARPMPAVA